MNNDLPRFVRAAHFLGLCLALTSGACGNPTTYKANNKPTSSNEDASERRTSGSPCTSDGECASDVCLTIAGKQQCADRCSADVPCQGSLICVKRDPRKVSAPLVCVDKDNRSCQACSEDNQCGDVGNACVQSPDGKLCGIDCSAAGDAVCPQGTMCIPVRDADGNEVSRQCIPNKGACKTVIPTPSCTGLGCNGVVGPTNTGTPGVSGSSGSTGGSTTCVPSAEVCDGIDNDCDGKKDEGADGLAMKKACGTGVGMCVGFQTCTNGAWGACDAPAPATETCNGKDDNCDGNTDEGLLSSPDSCGACDNVCPGGAQATRTCNAATCGISCKSTAHNDPGWLWYDHYYDNDNNPANGCEMWDHDYNKDSDHSQTGTCQIDDSDNGYCQFTGRMLADSRTHEVAPNGRSTPQGGTNALDWYKVYAIDRAWPNDLRLAARLDVSFLPTNSLYEVCLSKNENSPTNMDASCGAGPAGQNWWCSGMCCCAYGGNRVWTGLLDDEVGWDDGDYYMRVRWVSGSYVPTTSGMYYTVRMCDDSGTKNCQL